ncbi:MAG TPA: AMP-binding protein [Methanoregulaceae archaeon]|nr:AMP-binding protein [Methanoregulaceae archaeon]
MAGLAVRAIKGGLCFLTDEWRRGTLLANLIGLAAGNIARDMSWAELLEERARQHPHKRFLTYRDETFTYRVMDANADRAADFLVRLGGGRGKGLGIFMKNSPRFLDIFFGSQKIGMYSVPMNPALKADGLKYIITHSDIDILVLDAELLPSFLPIAQEVALKAVIVDDIETEARGFEIPPGMHRLGAAYTAPIPTAAPSRGYDPADMCLILYTSGTTGQRKGVVYRYHNTGVKKICLMGGTLLTRDDIYYTPLSLIHANALFLTMTCAMAVGATVALSRRFSASAFWDEIRSCDATIFNTLGAMIPIIMKQPERTTDRRHKVRRVLSAACPADMWPVFEQRFGVMLYEGYGAVDGGGKGIINFGSAPIGSLGRPMPGIATIRIVDAEGRDAPDGMPGELLFKAGDAKSRVEYYKNDDASNEKVRDGWLYTGDLVRRDAKGYLYFVGRNKESMRIGGENVSAYEVEHVILQHPAVEDAAVYAVPSDMAEDDIMASIKLVQGQNLDPPALLAFLGDRLERFAVPRYVRIVTEFPMTHTHRIIKPELEQVGVTPDTYDAKAHRSASPDTGATRHSPSSGCAPRERRNKKQASQGG